MENLFSSDSLLLSWNSLSSLLKQVWKVVVSHVLSPTRRVSFRFRHEQDLSFSHHTLKCFIKHKFQVYEAFQFLDTCTLNTMRNQMQVVQEAKLGGDMNFKLFRSFERDTIISNTQVWKEGSLKGSIATEGQDRCAKIHNIPEGGLQMFR